MAKHSLTINKSFKEELIDPVLKEKNLKFTSVLRSIIRKVSKEGLSSYAIDSELFPTTEGDKVLTNTGYDKNLLNPVKDAKDRIKMKNLHIEIGKKEATNRVNLLIKDELYGFFMNYSDDNLLELLNEYGDIYNRTLNSNPTGVFISKSSFKDPDFILNLKANHLNISSIIKEILYYMTDNNKNIFNWIDSKIIHDSYRYKNANPNNTKEIDSDFINIPICGEDYKELSRVSRKLGITFSVLICAVLRYMEDNPAILENYDKYVIKKPFIRLESCYGINDINNLINKVDDFDKFKKYFLEKFKYQDRKYVKNKDARQYELTYSERVDDLLELRNFKRRYGVSWGSVFEIMKEYVN